MLNGEDTRLKELEETWGEDFSDAIATAQEIYSGEGSEVLKVKEFFLAVLFAMPLPKAGAADEIIKFIQES